MRLIPIAALALFACDEGASSDAAGGGTAGSTTGPAGGSAGGSGGGAGVGAGTTGGSSADGGNGLGGAPPVVVNDCGELPPAGTFEQLLPASVTENFAFAVDPINAGVVYVGTAQQGIWKTTDCGSTWVHINTGKNGAVLDSGMNWTFVIDPYDSEVLYTNAGYGQTNNAYKSVNGGVDWDVVWPPPDGSFADVVEYDFTNVFAMDPNDPSHLLLTFHATCSAPFAESCIAETFDGGETWNLIDGNGAMVGTEGQVIYFLDNAETWLWASQSSGFWRTSNGGDSWTKIAPTLNEAHPQGSQLYRAVDGTFYVATADGLARSSDGASWSLVPGTNPLAGGIVGDGTTMYLSNSFYWDWGTNLHPFFSAPEASGEPWTELAGSPGMTSGGSLGLDSSHRILYSSTLSSGFWRIMLPPE